MSKTLYLVDLSYIRPLSDVDLYRDQHIEFLNEFYGQGNFIFSGPKSPRTGGVILAQAPSKEALLKILENDPFHQEKIAQYQITEFTPSMFSDSFKNVIV